MFNEDEVLKNKTPIENKEIDVEKKDETPKEKLPFIDIAKNTVSHFVSSNGYSSLAIGAGICIGVFLFVKYKIKK